MGYMALEPGRVIQIRWMTRCPKQTVSASDSLKLEGWEWLCLRRRWEGQVPRLEPGSRGSFTNRGFLPGPRVPVRALTGHFHSLPSCFLI